jgi:hypothetical protein
MIKKTIAAALVATGLMFVPAQAEGVKLGTLTCQMDSNVGLLIGSVNKGACTYRDTSGRTKHYTAKFSRLGVDVGVTGNKTIVWAVFGVDGKSNGGLKGTYTGVNAEASVVFGVGANALVGGFKSGIVLNPVSISGQTGLNVAAGVATLTLE